MVRGKGVRSRGEKREEERCEGDLRVKGGEGMMRKERWYRGEVLRVIEGRERERERES